MNRLFSYALVAAALTRSFSASATECSALPSPIYVTGIMPTFLPTLAAILASSDMTLVFNGSTNDCAGLKDILPPNSGGTTSLGAALIWDVNGNPNSCDIPFPGLTADIGITGLFPAACATSLGLALPPNLADAHGPEMPYVFVTPAGAGAPTAISAEQAYYVYGYGYYGGISPWDSGNQQNLTFFFTAHQATVDITGGAIGAPQASMLGTMISNSSTMAISLGSARPAISAIGMLSSDVYDASRAQLSALAFRGYGQDFAWLPDSNGGFDKRNVREGRYVMFAPMHFLALTADGGQAATSGGQTILDIVDGTSALPVDLTELATTSHLVPQCAMQVQRVQDSFDSLTHYGLVPNTRTQSCDCFFDAQTSTTSCASCASSPCIGGTICRRSYCEAF